MRDVCVFFFFFQAEDGIRDRDVTGVQTCALPICRKSGVARGGTTSIYSYSEASSSGRFSIGVPVSAQLRLRGMPRAVVAVRESRFLIRCASSRIIRSN